MRMGNTDDSIAKAIGARARKVLLSAETMAKQRVAHPELTITEYRLLPDIIEQGEVTQQKESTALFFSKHGRVYRAAVKPSACGELYLVTLHRLDSAEARIASARRLGRILRGPKE